jgi:cystathionine gamma-synthase
MIKKPQINTIAVRAGIEADKQYGAVVPPIYLSTNYSFPAFNQPGEFDYSRCGNPSRSLLANALSDLEGGAGAVVTSTGMSAIHLVCSLLKPGDCLLAPHDCYGGSYRLFDSLAKKGHFDVEFVNQNDDAALDAALAKQPALVWVETPSNPLLRIVDIQAIATKAKAVGALVAVDNTFLSPILQLPLSHGADFVVHSATKYINGHSDVVSGVVVSADAEHHETLAWWANCLGITGGAFDSYLVLRGLRTLGPRMRTHQENAAAITLLLSQRPEVSRVYYPGLSTHPGHAIAARQQKGFGGMLSFEVDLDEPALIEFLGHLKLFCLAESLGGVESLIAHPATMTHAAMSADAQREAGISPQLLRISAGLEATEDLLDDLSQAFDGVK